MTLRLRLAFGVAFLCALTVLHSRAQVTTGEIRGRITDWDDVPVAGAEIQIRMLERVPPVRTRSASDGTFRVPNLRAGGYRIIARHDQFGGAVEEDLWLLPGGSVVARLFAERPTRCALAPAPGTARLHGTVVDWNGLPSPAYVRLFDESESWERSRGTSAGLDGRYEIDHVPPGRHALHVWIRGFEPAIHPIEIGPDQVVKIDTRLDLAKRKPPPESAGPTPHPKSVLSPALGGVHGRVTDMGFGAIPGATATLRSAGRSLEAITDVRGVYSFANLLPGQYELRVSLAGFRTSSTTVVVSNGRWSSGDATLEIGPIEPHETAVRWKLRRSEWIVGIKTNVGDITLAIARNDFLACVERGAYTAGRLEFLRTSETSTQTSAWLRLLHGQDKPAAAGATAYALRLDDTPTLVVVDAHTGQEGRVEGRVVEGFDVIARIRERLKQSNSSDPGIRIESIRLMLL